MEKINLTGSIDLLKLQQTGLATIKGVRCVVIPVEDNDLYITKDAATGKAKSAYISFNIIAAREVGKFGDTHYCKQSFSKEYRETRSEVVEARRKVYLGNFKPLQFEGHANAASSATAIPITTDEVTHDELPF